MENEEIIQNLIRTAQQGDMMEDFISSPHYANLMELILTPMYEAAFKAFQTVDPSIAEQVIQTQMIGKVINKIKETIESKIQQGKLAKQQLAEMNE